jgi:hypothetical protein
MMPGDLLLYVISAKHRISWAVFKRAFDSLAPEEIAKYDNTGAARRAVLDSFDGLGHCDPISDGDGLSVASTPSFLVRLPTVRTIAVLAGSRSPESIDWLRRSADKFGVTVEAKPQCGEFSSFIPQRVVASAETDAVMAAYSESIGVLFGKTPPAWSFAQLSAGLDDIVRGLKWEKTPQLNWRMADFDPEYNCFRQPVVERAEFRLTRYLDPTRNIFRYYIWNGDSCTGIDPEWGRYFVLQKTGFSALYFDRGSNFFAIPKTVPLPRLLRRAITLCSGSIGQRLPSCSATSNLDFVVFQSVPTTIAELVAKKVGQDLTACQIDVSSGGVD